jgi:hypothetical protein
MSKTDFKRYVTGFNVTAGKQVKDITFRFLANDFGGKLAITDLQLQEGTQVTAHVPNTSEMLETMRYSVDETVWVNSVTSVPTVKDGTAQPTKYTGLRNRFFNFAGRGHDAIAFPNVFDNDYTQELVSSALDLTIVAKDDFDLLRVSTNDGALIPDRFYDDLDHPLNYRYTREFYFDGGKAGDKIELKANLFTATLRDEEVSMAQKRLVNDAGKTVIMPRQRYLLAPWGSFRVRVEFYKKNMQSFKVASSTEGDTRTILGYNDSGIGFYGYGEFEQTKARARY